MIEPAEVQDLLGRWWYHYDQAAFGEMAELLTDDMHFVCLTDTGETDYEAFVRADVKGRDDVMAWQRPHRLDSPDPVRHHSANIHLTARRTDGAEFSSYILVTQILDGFPAFLSTGIVTGSARQTDEGLRLARMTVVLDTRNSIPMNQVTA